MRHSGNTGTVVGAEYTPSTATLKLYVHDELERFVTVAKLTVDRKQLSFWLGGMELAAEREGEDAQMPLPWGD